MRVYYRYVSKYKAQAKWVISEIKSESFSKDCVGF